MPLPLPRTSVKLGLSKGKTCNDCLRCFLAVGPGLGFLSCAWPQAFH